MNKRQKEVLQAQLNSEEEVIAQLKSVYEQALRDCEAKIQELSMRADLEPENLKSIIYQKQYQEAIKAQLEGALANLQSDSYATVSDYLTRSYQDGYLGSMYDMQGQGIPLVMPIDQEAVTRAVLLDSQLSTSLYDRMGEDVKAIKKAVRQEVSRGIAQGMTWSNIASNLARNMKHTPFQKAYNNSIRIARTEGHRIQNRAALDAQKRAIDRGAEVVKQWNAVLDGRTRSEHRELDGQIREVGEMFEIAGYKAEAPGLFGDPSQDCNCRCCLDQRARWALNCGIVKMDNFSKETVVFESPEEYAEWKKVYWSDENIEYMQHVTAMEKKYGKNFEKMLNSMTDKEYEKYKRLLDNNPMYKKKTALVKDSKNVRIELNKDIASTNAQIDKLKNQFKQLTDGYSYDEWYRDFSSIEDGFGDGEKDADFEKLKKIDAELKELFKKKSGLIYNKEKRVQLDTGYKGKIPDDKIQEYNKKAFEQIKRDTGYSDGKAKEFHNALLEYFGGDYETILAGENNTAQIIKNGMDLLPTYKGSIYRGMIFKSEDIKMFSELKPGDILPNKGMIGSWTSNNRTAISFGGINSYERSSVILECIDNKTGVGVQHISKFGDREAEVLTSATYEVVDIVIENKFDYLSNHKELLWFPGDLEDEKTTMKGNIVCRIKVKEKT